jgi:hypothetical protein
MRLLFCLSLFLALFAQFNAQSGEARADQSGTSLTALDVAFPLAASVSVAVSPSAEDGKHCVHIPCTSSTHDHTNAGCAGHASGLDHGAVNAFSPRSRQRVTTRNDAVAGLTLAPPVRPPLA